MIDECLVVEFRVTGDDCPLAAASKAAGVTIESQPPQLRDDGNALLRFGAPESDALASVLDKDARIRYLHRSSGEDRPDRDEYRCLSKQPCVVHELTDAGFMAETLTYRDGEERYTGAVVGYDVLQGVLEAAGATVGVTLERIYPLGPEGETSTTGRWDVTGAQEAAIRTALRMGYFAVPKQVTATEVGEELGISKSAFLERLRRGQKGLFSQIFG
ncbi:Predicted DNA binding protein, contains HTH domain [Halogranum gelatinilyticum]|uniref:Predicted DNA binding protein, contains HTH domain n=1 Tax=Halogranum gelatinilyticum TaxID=660521 RepID=A0A1G9WFM9_9EURY|nr:helix-turn-helix domain-containing protein [Halogranum gelatinilyticum]SDM83073.1 Predicted DNA binding protein, contains HTH domain [Halogranum gelatinilyticum]